MYVIFAFQKAFNLFLPRSRSTRRLDSLWLTWRQQAYYITCMLHKSSALEIASRIAVTVTYSKNIGEIEHIESRKFYFEMLSFIRHEKRLQPHSPRATLLDWVQIIALIEKSILFFSAMCLFSLKVM